MTRSILLREGWIVTAEETFKASLRVEGEKIVEIGDLFPREGEEELDCRSCYLLPGGIETHTHLQLESMGTVTADDFASGTKAALAGGTTTVLDFATQFHGESMAQGLRHWEEKSRDHMFCDLGFHMAMTEWNAALRGQMEGIVEAGISSFKLYMAYKDNMMVRDDEIYQALKESARLGAVIGFHCENGDLIAERVRELRLDGRLAPYWHQHSRPASLEREAIQRLETIAMLLDAPHYVVHLSTAAGLSALKEARSTGSRVAIETCPQYLLLDQSLYGAPEDESFEAAKYIMSPPLRSAENKEALWQGLANGEIQFVGSDHCSFNFHGQKEMGRGDFSRIPNGAPGIELRLPLLYSYGVAARRFSINRLAAVASENAARYFGLFPRKGILAPGSDADISILDPEPVWTLKKSDLHEKADYSPYEGLRVTGRVRDVFLRGHHAVSNGKVISGAEGRWLKRGKPQLDIR